MAFLPESLASGEWTVAFVAVVVGLVRAPATLVNL
jgi:hypothetical protein